MKGIYKIENRITGQCYVGQSQDIEARFENHKVVAKLGTPELLYQAMRQYGPESFVLTVLEVAEDNLDELERHYIQECGAFYKEGGYNMTMGGKGKTGFVSPDETRKKISEAHVGVHKGAKNPAAVRVICDGKVFGCVKDCAEFYGVAYSRLKSWLYRKRLPLEFLEKQLRYEGEDFSVYRLQPGKTRGERHHFYGSHRARGKNPNAKSVFCGGEVFSCLKDCADTVGASSAYLSMMLAKPEKMSKRFKEMGLRYLDTAEPSTTIEREARTAETE